MSNRGLVRTIPFKGFHIDLVDDFEVDDEYIIVHVCIKRAKKEYKGLSPMFYEPFETGDPEYPWCGTLENFWIWSKVYKHDIPKEEWTDDYLSKLGEIDYPAPSEKFFIERSKWFISDAEKNEKKIDWFSNSDEENSKQIEQENVDMARFRKCKKEKDKFLYCWYKGEKVYDYVKCRKFFYCYFYEKEVQKREAFKLLKSRLENGENICLEGVDAFYWSEENDPNCEELKEVLNDKNKTFGHEMVLACMLMDNPIWE